MKASGVWADEFSGAGGPKPLARAMLAIEMLLFERIGPDLPALTPEERAADAAIDSRLRCLAFVGVEHLDIKSLQNNTASPTPQSVEEQWAAPVSCLRAVSSAVGPSAKINKILDCAHEINRVLRQGNNDALPSADDFLPAMILVVKLANPPKLLSTLSFIQQYCTAYLLMSEPGCYFTHVQRLGRDPKPLSTCSTRDRGPVATNPRSCPRACTRVSHARVLHTPPTHSYDRSPHTSAVFFLDQLDADALSISQEEFDEGLLLANAQEQARLEMKRTISTAGNYARRPVSNRGTGRVTSCYPSCGMSSGLPGASVWGNLSRHGLAFSKWESAASRANSDQTGRGTDGSELWANELRADSDAPYR